jgi:hypothetical protein
MALDSEIPSDELHLDRRDRELKLEQLKWPLYVLDEVIVAPSPRSSQLIRASGLQARSPLPQIPFFACAFNVFNNFGESASRSK